MSFKVALLSNLLLVRRVCRSRFEDQRETKWEIDSSGSKFYISHLSPFLFLID